MPLSDLSRIALRSLPIYGQLTQPFALSDKEKALRRGVVSSATLDMLKMGEEPTTQEEKTQELVGSLAGMILPFSGISKGVKALGLPAKFAKLGKVGGAAALGATEFGTFEALRKPEKGFFDLKGRATKGLEGLLIGGALSGALAGLPITYRKGKQLIGKALGEPIKREFEEVTMSKLWNITTPQKLHRMGLMGGLKKTDIRTVIKDASKGRTSSASALIPEEMDSAVKGILDQAQFKTENFIFRENVNKIVNNISQGKFEKPLTAIPHVKPARQALDSFKDKVGRFFGKGKRFEFTARNIDRYDPKNGFSEATYKPWNKGHVDWKVNTNNVLKNDLAGYLKQSNTDINKMLESSHVLSNGKAVPTMEKLEIYMASKNPGKWNDILKDGFTTGTSDKIIKFSRDEMKEIATSVIKNPQEKGLAEWALNYYRNQYDLVAPIYKKIHGKPLPKQFGAYSPRNRDYRFLNQAGVEKMDFKNVGDKLFNESLSDISNVKALKGGKAPLKLNFLENTIENVNNIEYYKAMAEPINNISKIHANPLVHKAIKEQFGKNTDEIFTDWYKTIARPELVRDHAFTNNIAKALRINSTTAVLGYNMVTPLKQVGSLFNSMAEVPVDIAMSSIREFTQNPKKISKLVRGLSKEQRIRGDRIDRDLIELAKSKEAVEFLGMKPKKILSKMKGGAFNWIRFMDKQAIDLSWYMKYKHLMTKNPNVKSAIEGANSAMRRHHPQASVGDLPQFFKDGELAKWFTTFGNQLNVNYNNWAEILNLKKAGKLGKTELAKRALFTVFLPATAMSLLSTGFSPKKESYAKDVFTYPLSGFPLVGGMMSSLTHGFDIGTPLPLKTIESVGKAFTSRTPETKIKHAFRGLGGITGIPTTQVERTLTGLKALATDDTNDLRRLVWSKYALDKKGKIKKRADSNLLKSLRDYRGLNKVSV